MPVDTPLRPQPMTVLPTFQWHGARPRLLDLERYEQGWAVALILQREGDCRLIPLAWLYEQPLPDDDRFPPGWPLETDAIHEPTLNQTLQEWQREGWELRGRIELQFIGLDTDPNFWPTIHTHLWQNQTDERQGIKNQ